MIVWILPKLSVRYSTRPALASDTALATSVVTVPVFLLLDVESDELPEFDSDDAEFILDVVNQYLALIEGSEEDKKKIVRRYAAAIVDDLKRQIYASKEESTDFVFKVQKNLIIFGAFIKNMKADGRLYFKKEVPDKKNIKNYLFGGYKKSYYPENAFDSDDERCLSVILEEDEDVIRFIKPPLNQLGLFYKAAKQYNPTSGRYSPEEDKTAQE